MNGALHGQINGVFLGLARGLAQVPRGWCVEACPVSPPFSAGRGRSPSAECMVRVRTASSPDIARSMLGRCGAWAPSDGQLRVGTTAPVRVVPLTTRPHAIPCYPMRAPADRSLRWLACNLRVWAKRQGHWERGIASSGTRGDMDRFVSNYTLRLDAKGRVSIPAPYRAVLARDGFEGLYVYPTLDRPALDAGGNASAGEIERLIERFAPFSDEREDFAAALYGTSETLKIDGEGRVVLSEPLKAHAGHCRCDRLCGPGSQVSNLGARAVSRAPCRGHWQGAGTQKQLGSRTAADDPRGARE